VARTGARPVHTPLARYTRRIIREMSDEDVESFTRGLMAFVEASERISRVEPNLADVAMSRDSSE